ncbi:MAG: hypothetical protein Q9198_002734 [Flavoplaca austrocitrina]
MQTAAELGAPEPRRMASRPVDWIVEMMTEGAAVEVMDMKELGMEKLVKSEDEPSIFDKALLMSETQDSHLSGTEKMAS